MPIRRILAVPASIVSASTILGTAVTSSAKDGTALSTQTKKANAIESLTITRTELLPDTLGYRYQNCSISSRGFCNFLRCWPEPATRNFKSGRFGPGNDFNR